MNLKKAKEILQTVITDEMLAESEKDSKAPRQGVAFTKKGSETAATDTPVDEEDPVAAAEKLEAERAEMEAKLAQAEREKAERE